MVFLQTVVSGLGVGSLYALAAIGLVLIFKTSNVVNFAQGEMAMFSTFIAFQFLHKWGASYWIAFVAACVFALVLGWFVEWAFLSRLANANILSQIIVTLGLFLVFEGAAGLIWGNVPTSFPTAVSTTPVHVAGVVMTWNEIFIASVTVLFMLIFYVVFKYTMIGLAMRGVAQNVIAARLMGISGKQVFSWTWAISTLLGAVAGILIAPTLFLSPSFMDVVSVKAFAAAVLGGFSSLPGAVIGGLLLGVIENIFGIYVSTALKTTFVFALIIIVLYIRPTGLFGKKGVKKV
jgi:branched-chain amino acid transport system permease protein